MLSLQRNSEKYRLSVSHFSLVRQLWNVMLSLFGLSSVMTQTLVELMTIWRGIREGKHLRTRVVSFISFIWMLVALYGCLY